MSKDSNLTGKKSGRRYPRYRYFVPAQWDFYTGGTGKRWGYVENVSERGCLLKTSEPIEDRRWVRIMIRDPARNLWCAVQGRTVRVVPRGSTGDMYRYGIEFAQALNWVALSQIKEAVHFKVPVDENEGVEA